MQISTASSTLRITSIVPCAVVATFGSNTTRGLPGDPVIALHVNRQFEHRPADPKVVYVKSNPDEISVDSLIRTNTLTRLVAFADLNFRSAKNRSGHRTNDPIVVMARQRVSPAVASLRKPDPWPRALAVYPQQIMFIRYGIDHLGQPPNHGCKDREGREWRQRLRSF